MKNKKWLRIERHKDGIRVYIFGVRVHHLEAGLILIFLGWLLVLHDWLIEKKKIKE